MVFCQFGTEFSGLTKPSFEYDVGVQIDNLAHDSDIRKVLGFFLAIGSIDGLASRDQMRLIDALDDACAMKHLNHFVVIRMLKMGCERVTVFPQFIDLDASGNGGVGRKTII